MEKKTNVERAHQIIIEHRKFQSQAIGNREYRRRNKLCNKQDALEVIRMFEESLLEAAQIIDKLGYCTEEGKIYENIEDYFDMMEQSVSGI